MTKSVTALKTQFRIILGMLPLFLWACNSGDSGQSKLFQEIQADKGGIFRGLELGMDLERVKKVEIDLDLRREDNLGLAYQLDLGPDREIWMEYYRNSDANDGPAELVSIICNMKLQDQVEAAELYREYERFLSSEHGLALGVFGDRTWIAQREGSSSAIIHLVLLPGKERITLNIYRPEEFYGKEN